MAVGHSVTRWIVVMALSMNGAGSPESLTMLTKNAEVREWTDHDRRELAVAS